MILSTHIESEIGNLSETLVNTKFEDAENVIEDFCKKNQMIVSFEENGRIYQYGDTNKVKTSTDKISSLSQEMMFADRPQSYLFTIVSLTSSNQELISALLKLLPFLLALIFSVSLLVAWICSRIIVRPITEISEISRRMANLDMTWECRINRTDEIGVLANSLNSMSHNLSNTMMELETANQHLKQDMEHIDELNKQRQYFFATASHELKTPITIIKGQVESMIMGIGRYKDTHEVLPETLKEIENIASIDWENHIVNTNDFKYSKIAEQLQSMQKVVIALTIITSILGLVVLMLILTLRIRGRIQEAGILLAIGKTKQQIIGQFLLEAMILLSLGFLLSTIIFLPLADTFNSFLFDSITQATVHKNYLQPDFLHFAILFVLESLGTFVTVLVCSGAILSLKPKEILTKMS